VRVGGQADPEVQVRLVPLAVAARADRAHDLSFLDRSPGSYSDRAEVHEGDRVAVGCANRQAEPFVGHLPDKRDDAGGGSPHVGTGRSGNVDPPVLTARVRVVLGDERPEHRAVDRPRPSRRGRAERESEQRSSRAEEHSVADLDNHERAD